VNFFDYGKAVTSVSQIIKSFISDNTVHIKSKKRGYRGTDRSRL